jgi:hypothetical protein
LANEPPWAFDPHPTIKAATAAPTVMPRALTVG